jgi:hypothetical protein
MISKDKYLKSNACKIMITTVNHFIVLSWVYSGISYRCQRDRCLTLPTRIVPDTTVIRRRLAKFTQFIWQLDFGLRCRCEILSPIGPDTFSSSHLGCLIGFVSVDVETYRFPHWRPSYPYDEC